jgi:hypothetical protein
MAIDPDALPSAMSDALGGFGGFLRCESCGKTSPVGDPGRRVTGAGWPKCCGYTMRWWTDRQIDDGEVTCAACSTRTLRRGETRHFPIVCDCGWGLIASRSGE